MSRIGLIENIIRDILIDQDTIRESIKYHRFCIDKMLVRQNNKKQMSFCPFCGEELKTVEEIK